MSNDSDALLAGVVDVRVRLACIERLLDLDSCDARTDRHRDAGDLVLSPVAPVHPATGPAVRLRRIHRTPAAAGCTLATASPPLHRRSLSTAGRTEASIPVRVAPATSPEAVPTDESQCRRVARIAHRPARWLAPRAAAVATSLLVAALQLKPSAGLDHDEISYAAA